MGEDSLGYFGDRVEGAEKFIWNGIIQNGKGGIRGNGIESMVDVVWKIPRKRIFLGSGSLYRGYGGENDFKE